MLVQKENHGKLTGIKNGRLGPPISHLLFADDSLLFFKAEVQQAERVKQVLVEYGQATGQLINPEKCSIFFGETCPIRVQEDIKTVLGVSREKFEAKYLGLPTPDGRMSKGKCKNSQARLTRRIIALVIPYLWQERKQ